MTKFVNFEKGRTQKKNIRTKLRTIEDLYETGTKYKLQMLKQHFPKDLFMCLKLIIWAKDGA